MTRRWQVSLVVATAALALAAVVLLARRPWESAFSHGGPSPREVQDSSLRTVAIPSHPKRILSLCTSATDTLIRLGASAQLAAIDEYSRIVPGVASPVIIGKSSAISREQVLALNIDLALIWWYQDDAAQLLQDLSVPVVRLRPGRADELPEMIRIVGQCVDRAAPASRLALELATSLRRLTNQPAASAPRVYFELYGACKTVGRDSFINDLVELSGGRNIAADARGSILLSAERLLLADPEIILFVNGFATVNSIVQRAGWKQLSAVRNGRVRAVDRSWLVAGAGLPEAVAKFRALITETTLEEK